MPYVFLTLDSFDNLCLVYPNICIENNILSPQSTVMETSFPIQIKIYKIDFIVLNEFRRIQLQFATNRIKIGPIEPEIQPAKCCVPSLCLAYDVT